MKKHKGERAHIEKKKKMVGSLALPLFFSLLFSLLTLFFSFHTLFLNPHEFCCVGTRTADKQQLQMGRLCRLEEQTCPQRPPRGHGGGLLRAGCVRYLFFSDSNKLRFFRLLKYWYGITQWWRCWRTWRIWQMRATWCYTYRSICIYLHPKLPTMSQISWALPSFLPFSEVSYPTPFSQLILSTW